MSTAERSATDAALVEDVPGWEAFETASEVEATRDVVEAEDDDDGARLEPSDVVEVGVAREAADFEALADDDDDELHEDAPFDDDAERHDDAALDDDAELHDDAAFDDPPPRAVA